MSGIRRKPWLLRMPIPDPHTGITVVKTVGTYVTREEAEAGVNEPRIPAVYLHVFEYLRQTTDQR